MQILSTDQLRILDAISQGTVILKNGTIRHANACYNGYAEEITRSFKPQPHI